MTVLTVTLSHRRGREAARRGAPGRALARAHYSSAHSGKELPSPASLLRQYKRWEAGEVTPNEFYQPLIAQTFGTVTHAMFPVAPRRDANAPLPKM